MKLFIQPNDVLFFRDGKPFEAGSDHAARLAFPPNPATFHGAIRSAIMGKRTDGFHQFINNAAWEKNGLAALNPDNHDYRITGFGIARLDKEKKCERLYPVPADVVKKKSDKEYPEQYFILRPEKKLTDGVVMNFPSEELLTLGAKGTDAEFIENAAGFFTEEGMRKYLNGNNDFSQDMKRRDDVIVNEPRVGIGRDSHTHTSEEGKLFSIEFARMKENFGFAIETEGIDNYKRDLLSAPAVLRLGGESRSASVVETDFQTPGSISATGLMKLVLLTPAIFSKGWRPDGVGDDLAGEIAGCPVKLRAAAISRPIGIGGWDIVKRQAKPVRRAVPAGSVYYFECTGTERIQQSIIHIGHDTHLGLGEAIVGEWNYV